VEEVTGALKGEREEKEGIPSRAGNRSGENLARLAEREMGGEHLT